MEISIFAKGSVGGYWIINTFIDIALRVRMALVLFRIGAVSSWRC